MKDHKTITQNMIDAMNNYCIQEGINNSVFGDRLGVSHASVSRWMDRITRSMKEVTWRRFIKLAGFSESDFPDALPTVEVNVCFTDMSASANSTYSCLSCAHERVCSRVDALRHHFYSIWVRFECEDYMKGE